MITFVARLQRARDRAVRDDRGVALVVVLSVILILTLLVTAGTAFAVNQLTQVRGDQDWQAALAAAQAGVDDYTSRLNSDNLYWKYGAQVGYCQPTECTFALGTGGNAAFTGWVDVPGTSGRSQFRYEANNINYPTRGSVTLRASGRVGDEVRSVEVQVRRGGFIDFLYFTDYETQDPANYSPPRPQCEEYWYDGRSTSSCNDIQFATGDVINGPLHSNDAVLICPGSRSGTPNRGPVFNDSFSTGYDGQSGTSGLKWRRVSSCSGLPYFKVAGDPTGPKILDIPESNTIYRDETDPAVTDPPGCRYTGPTKIVLNSNGTMTVTSPATSPSHPVSSCVTGTGAIATGVTVPIPASGVVFVQDVPGTPDAFTNASPPGTCTQRISGGTARDTSGTGAVYTYTQVGNRVGFPLPTDGTTYSCTAGDVFLYGSLRGRLTIAAQDKIVVTDNVTYVGGANGEDLLGLIPNNYVEVYHPYTPSNTICEDWAWIRRSSTQPRYRYECQDYYSAGNVAYDRPSVTGTSNYFNNAVINAAILSVTHSFRVQNYNSGAGLGSLTVFGSIAQKYRGAVGTTAGTGYLKDYNYDYRLKYDAPPKFLSPVASPFSASQWSELTPVY